SIIGLEYASGLLGASYSLNLGERSQMMLQLGTNITYLSRASIDIKSASNGEKMFYSLIYANADNDIAFYLDGGASYLHRFKNSKFGVKAGVALSTPITRTNLITGNFTLYGTEENLEAELNSRFAFGGLSVGLLYYPQKGQAQATNAPRRERLSVNSIQRNHFWSLETIWSYSNKMDFTVTSPGNLQGSSIEPSSAQGQRISLIRNFPLPKTKNWGWYLGAAAGYSRLVFTYVVTPEFNIDAGPRANVKQRVGVDAIDYYGALVGINYTPIINDQSRLMLRLGASGLSPIVDGGNTFSNDYTSNITENPDSKTFFYLDGDVSYVRHFKNPRFGYKVGMAFSLPFPTENDLLVGDFGLQGTRASDTYQAKINSNFSFAGLSLGLLYFPQKR
ncbi:MAG: hypothetical protein AAF738_06140, partial [Bacteroidota bacterium]